MTNNESQQLVEFLGRKLTEVDVRLDQMASKEEPREQQAETRRDFDVGAEGLTGEIRQVAEGVLNVDEKLGRFRQEIQAEFDEVKAMIRFSYA